MSVHAAGLGHSFRKRRAVDGIDLDLGHGIVGLLGPNGAGKTTVLRMLATVLAPQEGSLELLGLDPTSPAERTEIRRNLGYLPQDPRLYPNFSPYDLVDYVALLKEHKDPVARREEVRRVLEQVGLADRSGQNAGSLAYGQKRALEMALALALDPRLLLLDEPTAGMGVEDVDRTIELVKRSSAGRTVVFVDHNMHVVGSLADTVTVLQSGQVLAQGSYDEVRNDERVITAYLGQAG